MKFLIADIFMILVISIKIYRGLAAEQLYPQDEKSSALNPELDSSLSAELKRTGLDRFEGCPRRSRCMNKIRGYCRSNCNDKQEDTGAGCSKAGKEVNCKCCAKKETTTEATTTTEASTTPPRVYDDSLPWIFMGSDRFVLFQEEMNWHDARALCMSHGLDIFIPKNVETVATYLKDNFSENFYWLLGRGNGTHMVYLGGRALTRDDPWYATHYGKVAESECLDLCIKCYKFHGPNQILATGSCTWRTDMGVLCGY